MSYFRVTVFWDQSSYRLCYVCASAMLIAALKKAVTFRNAYYYVIRIIHVMGKSKDDWKQNLLKVLCSLNTVLWYGNVS